LLPTPGLFCFKTAAGRIPERSDSCRDWRDRPTLPDRNPNGPDDFDRDRSFHPDLNGTLNAVPSYSSLIAQNEVRMYYMATANPTEKNGVGKGE